MRRLGFRLLVGMTLLGMPVCAQDIPVVDTDSLATDSLAIDSLNMDPEWYVAPLVREADFAPRRAAAANCPVDSVLTFNVDSVLVEVTMYEYGDTTRTMVWTVNADGSRVGKSRTESASTATTSYSATYAWDANTNNWKGTSKEEHTYNSANKETLRVLYNTWLNNAWVADTKYTWTYDASNREHEYTTYTRNTSTNQLVLSKQRIREYNAAGKTTLDIQYTAHNGTAWSAGTKKIYDYDASGNQIEYTYYSSLSNGNWVGSTHEVWVYTGGKKTYYEKQTWSNGTWVNSTKEIWAFNAAGKQTLHEKYNGSNSTWSLTLQENSDYDAAGNNTLVENYNVSNGVFTGSKKEEYTYVGTTKTGTITYKWDTGSNAFVYKSWSVNNTADNPNEKCSYNWSNGAWVGTGTRTLTTKTAGKVTEVITQNWPTNATDWVNKTCTTTVYVGANKTQEAYYTWQDDDWKGTKRTDYHYNASNKNDTTITYTYSDGDWIYSNRTVYTFNASGTAIMTHNAQWQDNAWVMTTMTRTDISDITVDGIRQTLNASWKCNADSVWIGVQKDTTVYTITGKPQYNARFSSWANNDWVPSYKVNYAYDGADRSTLEERYNWTNNKWQGFYRYEYEYNENNQPILSIYYGSWDETTDSWIGSSRLETTYNEAGKTTSMLSYSWKNNTWQLSDNTLYSYDAQGNQIEQITQKYTNDTWVNLSRFEKEYQGSTLVKSNEYKWINNDWQITRRNESYYDEDAQAKLRQKIDGRWNNGNVTSFTNQLYAYACDPRFFTIRFVNYDGTELSSVQIEEGQTPSYEGEEPTKPETAEYTYSFAGWSPSIVPVAGNATYTATYTATKRSYTITWLREDGSEIEHETLEYGATPAHANINKESTDEFTYAFAGWTPGIGIVTGDATYTATFNATKNSYTITWLNDDNTQIDQTLVEYGVVPTHTAPTKEATDEHSYFFAGWTPEVVAVTGEATYKATYTETTKVYTITWLNEEGVEISHETLEYGATPQHSDPTKEATDEFTYTFAGWDPAVTSVTGDASYTATFTATKRSYTITWLNEDGTEIEHQTLEYGVVPQHTDATKENTAEYTYTFTGWSPEVTSVTGDATYTAQFNATQNSYKITWMDDDDSLIDETYVLYGIVPTHTAPTKEATDEHSYFFDKWTPDVVAVTGEATYKASYTETTKVYTITWLNENGTEISHETLEYGANPTHVAPTKEATDEFTYTFAGWNPAVTSVKGDASYTATFTATKRNYTITWLNEDGSELSHETLEYGAIPQHTDATKENTAEYTYSFIGWSPEVTSVTGDATYTAQFNATQNSYKITWMDDDDSLIDETYVLYGIVPTHVSPTKEATDEHSYFFDKWTPDVVAVTGEATYKATYTETTKVYTITWLNENGTEIDHQTLEYGANPTHVAPTKEATDEFTYTFAGWNPAVTSVTGDASYTATFTATKRSYTITWLNENGTEIDHTTVEYGVVPTHADATKENTLEYTYTFSGWTPQVVAVTGDATYTATFSSTANTYIITWKDENGVTLDQTTVTAGTLPAHADPVKQNTAEYTYAFTGWSPEVVAAVADATYQATFSATKNSYTITWLDDDNSIIEQKVVEYGNFPAHVDPVKQNTAEYTYSFTGWSPALASVTGEATYKATYNATKNSYEITWLNDDNSLIDKTTVEYGLTPQHADASKQNTAEYTYTFTGWTPAIVDVSGDATYKATFSQTKNTYVITFLNYDGTELQTGDVEYGVVPTYTSATPTKPADAQGTYTFAGWDEEIAAVTGAKTYTATFSGIKSTYTITFYFGDGVTILEQMELAYGEMPEMTLEPARLSDPEFSYTFAGWEPAIAPVTADADYVAVYTATTNSYTIIFRNDDGTELQRDVLDYGILPIYAGEEPTKEEDERYTYEFAGWKPAVDIAKADAVYTATYTATKKKKQGIEDVVEAGAQATKIYIEGNIYILRAGHAYAPDGTKIK